MVETHWNPKSEKEKATHTMSVGVGEREFDKCAGGK